MEFKELIKEISSAHCKPIYVVSSEELFFVDKLIQFIGTQSLSKEQQEFNQSTLYGKETSVNAIIDLAREYPFMGEKRVILVKEAQEIKNWEALIQYAKHPLNSTLLVVCFSKKPDGRSSWVKQLKESGYYHEWKGLSDFQIPAFIKESAKEMELVLEEEAQQLLLEYIGNDLANIINELEKLKLIRSQNKKITKEDIVKYIGISKEYNVFELQKAISTKDHRKIYWISNNMAQHHKSNPLIATIGALFNHFHRIWICKIYQKMNDDDLNKILKLAFKNFIKEYRDAATLYSLANIESAFQLLSDYDLKIKGLYNRSATEKDLYLELALKICQL